MDSGVEAIINRFRAALESGSVQQLKEMIDNHTTEDFVQEWPQSGERVRGRANAREINDRYTAATGTEPKVTFRRALGADDLFVIEMTIDYGDGTPVNYVGVGEVRDGKVARMTEYFANPFQAPDWRAEFTERMEETVSA